MLKISIVALALAALGLAACDGPSTARSSEALGQERQKDLAETTAVYFFDQRTDVCLVGSPTFHSVGRQGYYEVTSLAPVACSNKIRRIATNIS